MLEEGKLQIARDLDEAARLVEELVRYGRDEGYRDDLALALALACWKMRMEYPDEGLEDPGSKVRKGPMSAADRQAADEFVGAIMGVSAKWYR
jgi:hypothetical protein